MILLLGGASETSFIAERLASEGYSILVSKATNVRLDVGNHPNISLRTGRLDLEGLISLVKKINAVALLDATHPFATMARTNAQKAAGAAGIPYITYIRPMEVYNYDKLTIVDSHEAAAKTAFSHGCCVLLTTGSRTLAPYANLSRQTGCKVVARVLDHPASIDACKAAGLASENVIAARGPFSTEVNIHHCKQHHVGALVTKDSGAPGGVAEKIEAARRMGIHVVMIKRPDSCTAGAYDNLDKLVDGLKQAIKNKGWS